MRELLIKFGGIGLSTKRTFFIYFALIKNEMQYLTQHATHSKCTRANSKSNDNSPNTN